MAAGGRINSVYTKYGSNTGKSVFLAIGDQNAATIVKEMTSASGQAPLFPVVGGDGGSSPLWQDYEFSKFGTSFLFHLTKQYEQLPISGEDGYGIGIGMAKADTCCKTAVMPPKSLYVDGFRVVPAMGRQCVAFTATKAGMHAITLYSASGRRIDSKQINCSVGIVPAALAIAAPGMYVVRISGASGEMAGRWVFGDK